MPAARCRLTLLTHPVTPASEKKAIVENQGKIIDPFSTVRLLAETRRTQTNLPSQPTPLVDREKEMEALRELLLQEDVRLVTLTGTGGTGKTRLAIELAAKIIDEFPSGTFLVSLAQVADPRLVVSAIVSALGIIESPGKLIEQTLYDFLRTKRMLLLLDNFEQVVAAAPAVTALLGECPKLKILVTSREPLRVRGEHELAVPPLAVPNLAHVPKSKELLLYAAVALFVQRTQAARADFSITTDNAITVAEICSRLDGLPLALELAAARARVLSPESILLRLQNRLELLRAGPRDLPPRQQTLRNTIAWSYDLLDGQDKRFFAYLSVFPGSFSLKAADEICAKLDHAREDVLDQLTRLVEKSLLLSSQVESETRFTMLATIREFAHECLVTRGESIAMERRFADFYLALAEEAESKLTGREQGDWLARLDREHNNLQAALQWAIENEEVHLSLRFASSLWYFWYIRGHWTEGRLWLTRVLSLSGAEIDPLHAKTLRAAGVLASVQDDFSAAQSYLNESLTSFRQDGNTEGEALALNSLGLTMIDHGELLSGKRLLDQSLALMKKSGDKWGTALVLNNLGVCARAKGENDKAIEFHNQSLELFRELEDKRHIARMLINLGIDSRDKAEYDESRKLLSESLSLSREVGEKLGVAESLSYLGSVARRQGDIERACRILRESLAMSVELGNKELTAECLCEFAGCALARGEAERATRLFSACKRLRNAGALHVPPAYRADREREVAEARTALGEKRFAAEWAKGNAMELEDAVAYTMTGQRLALTRKRSRKSA